MTDDTTITVWAIALVAIAGIVALALTYAWAVHDETTIGDCPAGHVVVRVVDDGGQGLWEPDGRYCAPASQIHPAP